VTAAWFGTVPAVIRGGLGTLAVVGTCGILFPALWRLGPLHLLEPTPANEPVPASDPKG
jgi:hypothetical protein